PYWSRTLDEAFNQQLGTLTLDEEDEFGKGIKIPFNETCNKDHCWYNIQFDALVTTGNDPDETQLICHLTRIDQPYGYTAFKLGQYPEFEFDKWVHYSYWWISPHPRIRKDRLITFLWGRKQNLLYRN